jgi:Glycosyltransferases involved in cell wall biogenesis
MNDLVSVVMPAFNAESTIDDTLRSVRAQTHLSLEILVVDDGSDDQTAEIVAAHARIDKRVRLIQKPNGGVASARNWGACQAKAMLLAFVDADDLWAPDKIKKQLLALGAGGSRVGLVYTWYAFIDAESRIYETYRPTDVGDVTERLCRTNFVGNGSSALVTREAFEVAGGFDPTLRALDAQGCEDWRFYFSVAEKYHFALVPELLTGYRQSPRNMSSDPMRMLRSSRLVAEWMQRRQPHLRAAIALGNAYYGIWLLERAVERQNWIDAAHLSWALVRQEPTGLLRWYTQCIARRLRNLFVATRRSVVLNKQQAPVFVVGEPMVSP